MSEVAAQERRAVPRKAVHRPATITLADNVTLPGQTVDLSSGGLRVAIDRSVQVPHECTFELTVMIDGQSRPITGSGRVLSCVCRGMHGFAIGIRFTQLNDISRATITRFLK